MRLFNRGAGHTLAEPKDLYGAIQAPQPFPEPANWCHECGVLLKCGYELTKSIVQVIMIERNGASGLAAEPHVRRETFCSWCVPAGDFILELRSTAYEKGVLDTVHVALDGEKFSFSD